MIIHDVAQLSPEWHELRCGKPTASDFHKIIQAKDGSPSKSQIPYAKQLAKDMQCHSPSYFTDQGKPVNVHVQRGRNLEEEAVAWYAMVHRVEARRVGFITTDDGRIGCSPDALIWDKDNRKWLGGIEIKCPAMAKHDKHVKVGKLPLSYKAQAHGGMAVTGLPYWIFLEYCPDSIVPTLCIKVEHDSFTDLLKTRLDEFCRGPLADEKKNLGIKEAEVTNDEISSAWSNKLAKVPGLSLLNSWLPELADIPDMATKRLVWAWIKTYGEDRGWVFKMETKEFVEA